MKDTKVVPSNLIIFDLEWDILVSRFENIYFQQLYLKQNHNMFLFFVASFEINDIYV